MVVKKFEKQIKTQIQFQNLSKKPETKNFWPSTLDL